jgi:hypothetical protein
MMAVDMVKIINIFLFILYKMTKFHPSYLIKERFENQVKQYHNQKIIKPYKQIPKNMNIPLKGIMLPHNSVEGNSKYHRQNGKLKFGSHFH